MTLASEGWVETKIVRVIAVADVAIAAEICATVRERMIDALKKLSPDAEWRISRFDRSQDSARLERWRAVAEARLSETALGGFDERSRGLSLPGMQVRIQTVQFVDLAEREAALGSLRAAIYAQAKVETDRLIKLWPERIYRVVRVDFIDESPVTPPPLSHMAKQESLAGSAPTDASDTEGGLAVAKKITLRAQVTPAPGK